MNHGVQRAYGREANQLRPVKITYNVFGYAPGSVLFEMGNTKILCGVSLQPGVPSFMKGKKEGWLTAEYALLPTSTHTRLPRESALKRNDRAIEISRIIGRSLRAVVDLTLLGERTIVVDCDVLQADGSTRTAAITGSYIALRQAIKTWLATGDIHTSLITDAVAAVSVGWSDQGVLLDLDYQEDSHLDADYNVILTQSGKIIEIQGTAEKRALSWESFQLMMDTARTGVAPLFQLIEGTTINATHLVKPALHAGKTPLFSLQSRLKQAVSEPS